MIERIYTLNDVRDAFDDRTFARGFQYQRQARATVLGTAEDGLRISGLVRGSRPQPYHVEVDVAVGPKGVGISGVCSCPMRFNCKHAAALLLTVASSGSYRAPTSPTGLASDLSRWLNALDDAAKRATEDYPADLHHRLFYVLSLERPPNGPSQLRVQPCSVRLRKDGTLGGQVTPYVPGNVLSANPAKHLRPSDHDILRRLAHAKTASWGPSGQALSGADGREILEAVVNTGRCRWAGVEGPVLSRGEPRPARPCWTLGPDGMQRFGFEADSIDAVLPVSPPWYADLGSGACGPLETGMPARIAQAFMAAPAVPPAQVEQVRKELGRRFPERPDLLVSEPPPVERVATAPRPHLRLFATRLERPFYWYVGDREANPLVAMARLSFDYDGVRVGPEERRGEPTYVRDGRLLSVVRDPAAESAAAYRLGNLGFGPATALDISYRVPETNRQDWAFPPGDAPETLLDLGFRRLPELRAAGWTVEIDDDWPYRVCEVGEEWTAEVRDGTGIDWFELDLGAIVDGRRVNLLPALLEILRRLPADTRPDALDAALGKGNGSVHVFVPLDDGRHLPLPRERLRPILAALLELFRTDAVGGDGALRLPALRAADLALFEQATANGVGVRWQGGEQLRELGRRLKSFDRIAEAPVPAGLDCALRSYQRDGLSWLQFLREYGLNGILADDMGLGKTVQTLAHLLLEKDSGRLDRPSLVVAPTSVVANWAAEAERLAPSLRVLVLHGAERKARFAAIAGHDLVLTSYPLLLRDHKVLAAEEFHLLVFDEAQTIKNPQASMTRIAVGLCARHRLCLTGTPLENHLGELWSLMHVLNPGLLGDRTQFTRLFRTPIEKRGDTARRDMLVRRVKPFILRRTKKEVERELPAKTEIVEHVELEDRQRDLYESIRLAVHDRVREEVARKGLARSHIVILDALLKLRQVCCDPRLVKLRRATGQTGSAKFERLMEMIPELLAEGRRILLFSQFVGMLDLIEAELRRLEVPFVRLTGETRDRRTPIRRFQEGKVPVFLISLKAGGFGLNLTAADTVIHYDPWWNPAVEAQATDRAHRIGQLKPVFVYKLITVGTVEEKIVALQGRKRELAEAVFAGTAAAASHITEADLADLFAPLGPA